MATATQVTLTICITIIILYLLGGHVFVYDDEKGLWAEFFINI